MSAQTSSHLQFPMPGGSSFRSRRSGSSTSSLSSTFSDFTSSTSASSSSPPTSKTNAFFASPFSTRPPSPVPHPPPAPNVPKSETPRSLTADFFATPVRPASPPPSSISATKQHVIHPSRIFPSRYTSNADRSPELVFLNVDGDNTDPRSHGRTRSSGSDSSFTSSFVGTRLPTPPPPTSSPRTPHRDDTVIPPRFLPTASHEDSGEPTPRPPDLEPTTLLHFERSLLLAAQAKQKAKPEPEPEPLEDNEGEDEEPHPGSLISLLTPDLSTTQLPLSPLSMTFTIATPSPTISSRRDDRGTPTPTNEPSASFTNEQTPMPASTLPSEQPTLEPPTSPTPAPTLRLLRTLGHGAFSSVWLAEDLSRVPLTLVSKKSVRDLRRRASGREREKELEKRREQVEECVSMDESQPTMEQGARLDQPSKPNRLREGLRNMLSFSRTSSGANPRFPTLPSNSDGNFAQNSSMKSSPSADPGELLRDSTFQSLPSNASDLSRNSSSRSFGAPSRNSNLRPLNLSRDSSLKKFRERVRGTRPGYRLGRAYLDERDGEMGEPRDAETERREVDDGIPSEEADAFRIGISLSRQSSLNKKGNGRLVAVKMTPRKVRSIRGREREEEERTKVRFVREVEVLKHISHPNITPLLAHLSTPSHHILVLPYLPGGDLLGVVNNDVAWGKLGESVLRRIWCELCKAVGWMHGVGLVHRDIKLENILLTTPAFSSLTESSPRPTLSSLPTPPAPFVKLTDFGLSRFVEIDANGDAELLSTRCGSEAYAAPELVTGGRGMYDARKTDSWACGVVLYALVGRQLPFGEGVSAQGGTGSKIGGERGLNHQAGGGGGRRSLAERRQWLMRIARGEWEWPGEEVEVSVAEDPDSPQSKEVDEHHVDEEEEELVGHQLVQSKGARRIVSRLLVRDPRKRARISDLRDDVWMCGGEDEVWWRARGKEGDGSRMPVGRDSAEIGLGEMDDSQEMPEWIFDDDAFGDDAVGMEFYDEPTAADEPLGDGEENEQYEEEEEEEEGGCLFDHEGIDSITRQEVI